MSENNSSGQILTIARELGAEARSMVEKSGCPAQTDMKNALMSSVYSLQLYESLFSITNSTAPVYNTLKEHIREQFKVSYQLVNRLIQCKTGAGASETTSAAGLSLSGSCPMNIQTDGKEDEAVLNKIISAIVKKACGLRSFADYAGSKEIESFFNIVAVDRYRYPRFQELHPNVESIMLFGPPGTGKTLLAEAVAAKLKEYGSSFISISASDIKGRYVGESEKSLKYLFDVARELTKGRNCAYGEKPVVVFMDEIDGLIEESGAGGGTGLLSEFNAQTAGIKGGTNKGLIVIAATNYPEKIPPAAFQRFSHRIFIGLPSLDDIRQILMTKLRKFGWQRINFSEPYLPKWMQSVDWNRNEFITTYLGLPSRGEPVKAGVDYENLKRWSYPGQLEDKDSKDPVSVFMKQATDEHFKDPRRDWILPANVNDWYFDAYAAEDAPWDVIDYMSWVLWTQYYAPREIDAIFSTMLLKAEQRSVIFASNNPVSSSRVFSQKWLLEKLTIPKQIDQGDKCVIDPVPEIRYSMIPLWYTILPDGKDASSEQDLEQSLFAQFKDHLDDIKFGETWGFMKTTDKNARTQTKLVPKWDLSGKNKDVRVIATQTETTNTVPVAQELLRGRKPNVITKTLLKRRQEEAVKYNETTNRLEDAPFIPTKSWSPKPSEGLHPENLPRILGVSQITFSDFVDSLGKIRSISIRNVDLMIEYAQKYGRSIKDGKDIKQLLLQKQNMEPETKNSERYQEIFHQFIDALMGRDY